MESRKVIKPLLLGSGEVTGLRYRIDRRVETESSRFLETLGKRGTRNEENVGERVREREREKLLAELCRT